MPQKRAKKKNNSEASDSGNGSKEIMQHTPTVTTINARWREKMFAGRRGLSGADLFAPVRDRRNMPVASDFVSKSGGIVPHPTLDTDIVSSLYDIYQFMELVYRGDPLVSGGIDTYCDHAIQNGYRIVYDAHTPEDEETIQRAEDWFSVHNMDEKLENIMRDYLLFGNVYIFIERNKIGGIRGLRIVHPMTMWVARDANGNVIRYLQRPNMSEKDTGGYRRFSPEDIIHLKNRTISDRTYGTSLIESMIRDLWFVRLTEDNLVTVIQRYASPLYLITLGLKGGPLGDRPAGAQAIDDFKAMMEGLLPGEDIIGDTSVHIDPITAGDQITDVADTMKHYGENLLAGIGVPGFLLGQSMRTGASGQLGLVIYESFMKTIRRLQRQMKWFIERRLFPELLYTLTSEQLLEEFREAAFPLLSDIKIARVPRFMFNILESAQDMHKRLRENVGSGIYVLNDAREELGKKPITISVKDLMEDENLNLADIPMPMVQAALGLAKASRDAIASRESGVTSKGDGTTVDGNGRPQKKDATSRKTEAEKNTRSEQKNRGEINTQQKATEKVIVDQARKGSR